MPPPSLLARCPFFPVVRALQGIRAFAPFAGVAVVVSAGITEENRLEVEEPSEPVLETLPEHEFFPVRPAFLARSGSCPDRKRGLERIPGSPVSAASVRCSPGSWSRRGCRWRKPGNAAGCRKILASVHFLLYDVGAGYKRDSILSYFFRAEHFFGNGCDGAENWHFLRMNAKMSQAGGPKREGWTPASPDRMGGV